MSQKMRFPNGGYDVNVVRKQEILNCIDDNIIDKEIALDLIKQLEIDATTYINDGKWTGLPFIGNIRVPKYRQMFQSENTRILKESASELLDKERYILFKKNLAADVQKRAKIDRYYKYILSQVMNKNMKVFRLWAKKYGDLEARIKLLTCHEMRTLDYFDLHYGQHEINDR